MYATFADCQRYLEDFGTNYYGSSIGSMGSIYIDTTSWNADLLSSYDKINTLLSGITRIPIVPVGTQPKTGSHHPYLVEWHAVDTIYTKLKSRHSQEFQNKLPEWITDFYARGTAIYDAIAQGHVIFDTDTTTRGIGYPVKVAVATSSTATLFSNWDSGFYDASDFVKTYQIKISGTTDGNTIGSSTFQVSDNNGYTWNTEQIPTSLDWTEIAHGFSVRWGANGTNGTHQYGDTWSITCTPTNTRNTGKGAKYREIGLG